MVATRGRSPHNAAQRQALCYESHMNPVPIIRLFARKHFAGPLAGDFLTVNIVQSRPGQLESGPIHAIPDVDQADMREELRDLERIEIGSRRHAAEARRQKPIVEEFALSLHYELGPKGTSGQHGIPPAASLERPANRLCFCDYVDNSGDLQAGKAGFIKNHNGLW
jgi:hypothetical protein